MFFFVANLSGAESQKETHFKRRKKKHTSKKKQREEEEKQKKAAEALSTQPKKTGAEPAEQFRLIPKPTGEFHVKIVFLAPAGTGSKTSFLSQYVTGSFNDCPSATIGANYHLKQLKFRDKSVRLELWDTAGQVH